MDSVISVTGTGSGIYITGTDLEADSGCRDLIGEDVFSAFQTEITAGSATFTPRSMLFDTIFQAQGNTGDSGLAGFAGMAAGDAWARMRSEDVKGLARSSVVFGGPMDKTSDARMAGEKATKWNWRLQICQH